VFRRRFGFFVVEQYARSRANKQADSSCPDTPGTTSDESYFA